MRIRSLRTRLFVALTAGATLLLVATGVVLLHRVDGWLQSEFDRGLEARARALVALTEQASGRIELDLEPGLMPAFEAGDDPEYFELRRADGSLVARSASFERDAGTRQAVLRPAAGPAAGPRFGDVRLADGRRGRRVQIDFVPRPDAEDDPDQAAGPPPPGGLQRATLVVARERERLDGDLLRLRVLAGGLAVALVVALAGLTQVVLRVGLRSLDRLTQQVRALDAGSLGTRVEVAGPPEEIAVVVEQVNALLDRLEAAFRRERQLSTDIAHELKTPIAELRSLCEVGARWPEDRAAAREFFEDAGAIALQMERVVTHLLALARCDGAREPLAVTPVPVAQVVEAAWRPLAREAAARRVELRQEIPPALRFDTDPDQLGLMIANILANAVAYAVPGTPVTCRAAAGPGPAAVSFSNRAERLEPRDLPLMFDRFWRKDEARTGGRHVGLGLSLVRAVAGRLGIGIATELDADRTFRLTLRGPDGTEADQNRSWASTPTVQAPAAPGKAAPGKK